MNKYQKQFTIDPHLVEVHELANLTPTMTEVQFEGFKANIDELGQLEPAKMYRGKLVDGRHRLKALKSSNTPLKYINIESTMSIEDVKEYILGLENRRHQTATQKAIMAYKEFKLRKESGEKVSQGEVAKIYGTTRQHLARAKKLYELGSKELVDVLFNGQKIKINGMETDNIRTICLHLENIQNEIVEESLKYKPNLDLTDEEIEYIDELIANLAENHNTVFLKALANKIYSKISC